MRQEQAKRKMVEILCRIKIQDSIIKKHKESGKKEADRDILDNNSWKQQLVFVRQSVTNTSIHCHAWQRKAPNIVL